MKCFYSNDTFDSVCAAAIITRKYPECELFPVDTIHDIHDSLSNDNTLTTPVYLINCPNDLIELKNISYQCDMTWVSSDKHFTHKAINAGISIPKYSVGVDRAACAIIWELLHPYVEIPAGVDAISRYALNDPDINCAAYNAALISHRCVNPEAVIWSTILHPSSLVFHVDMIKIGQHILDYVSETDLFTKR